MFFEHSTEEAKQQTAEAESQWWARQLENYLAPYSERLQAVLQKES
jgi:hypothetical protein